MALYNADTLNDLLTSIQQGKATQVILILGERFLIRQAADRICTVLLDGNGTIHKVDGSAEPFGTTINKLTSFSLLPGRQVFRVSDTRLFHSIKVAESLWKKAAAAYQRKQPDKAARYLRDMLASAGLDPTDPDNDPGAMPAGRWKKLFSFARPDGDLGWTAGVLAQSPPAQPSSRSAGDDAALLEETLEAGLPEQNLVLLLAEDVDKRKRLFRYLKEKQTVVDLSVDTGSSSRAKTAQAQVLHELIRETLAQFGTTMSRQTAELLCERVGFHPVAVVMETEKLCLHAGDRKRITRTDLEALVGRLGQDALFELTTAVAEQRCASAMVLADRLMDNGVHPLALLATLRNHARALLLFRSLQADPDLGYTASMSAAAFQKQCLPALKEKGRWQKELGGHPFAVYMQFKTAARFSPSVLGHWLRLILRAERRLKGSSLEPATVIHQLLAAMLISRPHGSLPDRRPGTGTLQNRSRGLQ